MNNILLYNGESPVLETPYRSPLAIVEAIKDIIKDKTVCELGAACGDLLIEMGKYAKEIKGMELDPERVKICQKRNLNVIEGSIYDQPIPEAEVYYFWCDLYFMLPKILRKGIWIIGSDKSEGEDKEIEKLNLPGYWIDVEYNEGSGWRENGIKRLFITKI